MKSRKEKGGIATGNNTCCEDKRQDDQPEPGYGKWQFNLFLREGVKRRQKKIHHRQCNNDGKTCDQYSFSQKLPDKREPNGAGHLAYADLLGAFHKTSRRKVHEIDAGNQQYENGNKTEQAHVFNSSPRYFAVFKIAMQVHITKSLNAELDTKIASLICEITI